MSAWRLAGLLFAFVLGSGAVGPRLVSLFSIQIAFRMLIRDGEDKSFNNLRPFSSSRDTESNPERGATIDSRFIGQLSVARIWSIGPSTSAISANVED